MASRTALDTLVLELVAPWPASLLLPRAVMAKYTYVFKNLFTLKFIERDLALVWHSLQPVRFLKA